MLRVSAADLPEPMYNVSLTVIGEQVYLLGGANGVKYTKSVYTCSVSALLQSCDKSSQEAKVLVDKANTWSRVADLPVIQPTCVSIHDRLLAIGGKIESEKAKTAVYIYSSTTNSWETISHMTISRYDCFTAVLPDNQLMVVGGFTVDGNTTNTVEFASVHVL